MTPSTPNQPAPAKAEHSALPWKVMPCPNHAGKHACHDFRWITTADAQVEHGHVPNDWTLESGELICEMRDHIGAPSANAELIVRVVNNHEIVCSLLAECESLVDGNTARRIREVLRQVRKN